MKTIKIISNKGWTDCPAHEIEGCDGLAVTMSSFGLFEVTHVKSGMCLIGQWERSANAMCAMVELSIAFKEAGINPLDDTDFFQSQIGKSQIKCKILDDLSVINWLKIVRPVLNFSGEFPWESNDEDPCVRLKNLVEQLKEISIKERAE